MNIVSTDATNTVVQVRNFLPNLPVAVSPRRSPNKPAPPKGINELESKTKLVLAK